MIDRIARALAVGAAAALLALALATMVDILMRWLFKAPIRGFLDIAALATAVIIAACFPALIVNRGNITIRLLGSLGRGRFARVLDSFGALVTAGFFSLMTWQYVRYAAEMTRAGETTAILRWVTWPWWWLVTGFIAITTIAAWVMFARDARGRSDPRGEPS